MYNDIGNITSVITTTKNGSAYTTNFSYGDADNPDRLTSYDGKAIAYNSMGCLASYDDKTYSWTRGKLTQVVSGTTASGKHTYNFTYNALGQRVEKSYSYFKKNTASGGFGEAAVVYTTSRNAKYYYDHSGRLIAEYCVENYSDFTQKSTRFEYLYDESGMVGFTYSLNGANPTSYYYQRNLQGDVVAIYNTSGTKIVEYAYDAWGNCTITYGANNDIATANAIRYRGYYFDTETGLYYLNARYYSPEWRRFISPDDTAYLDSESVNGLNLYCYCNNDPVNYCDPSGCFPLLAVILGITAAIGLGISVGGIATDNNLMTGIGLTMVATPALISGGLAIWGTTGALSTAIGIGTMAAGGFTGVFAGAEYQEAFTGQNFILDNGIISEGWYNTLMLTTAGLATLGTFASSFAYHFNINSIDKIGTLESTNYKGIRFTQKVQRSSGRKVTLYRTLEWHTHSHLGYNPHWQMNIFSKNGGIWIRGNALGRWSWWLTKI